MRRQMICVAAGICMMIGAQAEAEDVVLYSYAKTNQAPANWAVMPVSGEVNQKTPEALFEALKRRKMPTYGSTAYDNGRKSVIIDPGKCAYSSIIAAEISQTFAANGFKLPAYSCGGAKVPNAADDLTHFMAVVPFWQALGAQSFGDPALIQMGDEYLTPAVFKSRVEKNDKSVKAAIESGIADRNGFVRAGVMKAVIARKMPGAEKRVAAELASKDDLSVNAALEALVSTRNAPIVKEILGILDKSSPMQGSRARLMVHASDPQLREAAIVILLKSADDGLFAMVRNIVEKEKLYDIVIKHYAEILDAAAPAHAQVIAGYLIGQKKDELLRQWVDAHEASAAALAAAAVLAEQSTGAPRVSGLAALMESPDSITAYDAMDRLNLMHGKSDFSPEYWLRGMLSPHDGIRYASARAFDHAEKINPDRCTAVLERYRKSLDRFAGFEPIIAAAAGRMCTGLTDKTTIEKRAAVAGGIQDLDAAEKSSVKNGALIAMARLGDADIVSTLTKSAFDADIQVRRDVAYASRWLDTSGDNLRNTMLKDADQSVAGMLIMQIAHAKASDISPAMVKEIITRSERDKTLKIAALNALPAVIQEKTVQSVTTFAGNEMFDADESVKIAAIRALSDVAAISRDPIIVDNAVTSLALTAQDKSPVIVHHTLMGLARTKAPAALEIVERAKSTHPDIYQRVKRIYP